MDSDATLDHLFADYLSGVRAWCEQGALPDEVEARLQRLERRAGIGEGRHPAFRLELMAAVGALASEGRAFDYRMDERLHQALTLQLLEG